jgi:hypothetical protein
MPRYKAPLIDMHIPGAGWICPVKNIPSGPGTRLSGVLVPFFGKVKRISVDRVEDTCVVEILADQAPKDWVAL